MRFSAKLRNAYIHYNIEMESEKIKVQYSLLLAIYKKLYEEQFGKILTATKATQGDLCSIAKFASEFTIFRGFEIRKSDASDYKEDILLAQRHPSFTDKNGGIVPRIKFGAEKRLCKDIEEENCESNYISEIYLWEYCDDCGAKKDEYHLYHCDLEQCPICGRQALSCDCNMVWSE